MTGAAEESGHLEPAGHSVHTWDRRTLSSSSQEVLSYTVY